MKKNINNLRYDTSTAKLVGEWSNPHEIDDARWAREELYLKRTGEFFLYGEGGGLSPYASDYEDAPGNGKKIVPLSYVKAKAWAKEKLDKDAYQKLFEIVPDDDDEEIMPLSAFVSGAAKKRLDLERKKTGKTISEIIEELLISM